MWLTPDAQRLKNFRTVNGTRSFIIVFLSWTRLIQFYLCGVHPVALYLESVRLIQPIPQHPISFFRPPKSIFLPWRQRPRFTPIQNKKQNYGFVYFNFYVFRQEKMKGLNWMVASITRTQSALHIKGSANCTETTIWIHHKSWTGFGAQSAQGPNYVLRSLKQKYHLLILKST
jgi:hypothetical protein